MGTDDIFKILLAMEHSISEIKRLESMNISQLDDTANMVRKQTICLHIDALKNNSARLSSCGHKFDEPEQLTFGWMC